MAVGCEIRIRSRSCGVGAVGRCDKCNRAVCMSHSHEWAWGRFTCTPCIEKKRVEDERQSIEIANREARAQSLIPRIARRLAEVGVPQVRVPEPKRQFELSFDYLQYVVRRIFKAGASYGWYVGDYCWGRPYGYTSDISNPTYVALDGSMFQGRESFWNPLGPKFGSTYPSAMNPDVNAKAWESVVEALNRIAREHGVSVEWDQDV